MMRFLGAVVLLMGVALGGWIAYNLFIQRLPPAQGRNPLPALVLAAAFVYVGIRWLRGDDA